MSIFSKVVQSESKKIETAKDVVGGGGSFTIPSGIYPAEIMLAILRQSKGGAVALEVHYKLPTHNDFKLRETTYFTKKTGETTYERDGKVFHLPGYTLLDNLIRVATEGGGTLADMIEEGENATETVTVKLYDPEQKREVPTDVEAVTALHGLKVDLAVIERDENKTEENKSTGEYEPVNEVRTLNTVSNVFDSETGLTANEMAAGESEAKFKADWLKKWDGVKDSRYKEVAGAASSGSPKAATKPKSLFAKK